LTPSLNSEDGKVILHDARVDRRLSNAQGTLQHTTEFTGVQAHPVMEHIFATSDNHGQACLRDSRMAFGPLSSRSNEGIMQTVRLSFRSRSHLKFGERGSLPADELLRLKSIIRSYLRNHWRISATQRAAVLRLIAKVCEPNASQFVSNLRYICCTLLLGTRLAVTMLVSLLCSRSSVCFL
jgi:hypothetical protein